MLSPSGRGEGVIYGLAASCAPGLELCTSAPLETHLLCLTQEDNEHMFFGAAVGGVLTHLHRPEPGDDRRGGPLGASAVQAHRASTSECRDLRDMDLAPTNPDLLADEYLPTIHTVAEPLDHAVEQVLPVLPGACTERATHY